jgi:hypothetical protein
MLPSAGDNHNDCAISTTFFTRGGPKVFQYRPTGKT